MLFLFYLSSLSIDNSLVFFNLILKFLGPLVLFLVPGIDLLTHVFHISLLVSEILCSQLAQFDQFY